MTNQKIEITNHLISKLELISPNEKSFKSWVHKIWQNPRSKDRGGNRLTLDGFLLMKKAEIKYFEVRFNKPYVEVDNKFILWLDQTFNCPFYIDRKKIYFFNERPAVQLVLFSGDIQRYYKSHQEFSEKQLDKNQY